MIAIALYKDIVLINSSDIIDIVRRALSKIDPRLVEHGERVGYIAKNIYEQSADKSDFDFSKLFILCALHDIGAYKTDEIDDMLRFKSDKPYNHCLYGYLFLKNTTHLSEYAETLLYHHTDYSEMLTKNSRCSKYAEIIFLADRADIILNSHNHDLQQLRKMSGTKFNPYYVDALLKAQEKNAFAEKIISGNYKDEINLCLKSLNVKNSEIMDYLHLLVYAIDFRSPYTVTHTADTTIVSCELGKLLSLSEHAMQSLYIGSFLHDIGKIAIPQSILEKPARLTEEEFIKIKRHINEGEEILRGVVNDEICDIALRHHEKLDGSGYVLGLCEEQLTLPQRIVAVADIVSALSQERSYKKPFPRDTVISILYNMKNEGLLCPMAVDTICENYDTVLNKTDESHDPVKLLYKNLQHEYSQLQDEFSFAAKH